MNDVLTIAEAAPTLRMTGRHLYRLIEQDASPVPVIIIGHTKRILRADLERFLAGQSFAMAPPGTGVLAPAPVASSEATGTDNEAGNVSHLTPSGRPAASTLSDAATLHATGCVGMTLRRPHPPPAGRGRRRPTPQTTDPRPCQRPISNHRTQEVQMATSNPIHLEAVSA